MSILIFFLVFYVLLGFSLMKPFEKAGVDPKKAWIPGVAAMEWCKIIGRKPSYAALLLIPIVNIFIFAGMAVDLMRSFGRFDFKDAALSVIYAPLAFFNIGRDEKTTYQGPVLEKERAFFTEYAEAQKSNNKATLRKLERSNPYKKGPVREWTEAIVFAVFAAAFIRMFLIEAYVIPTSSMEGTMKVGDFLFVSKVNYGIRTPMTVIQFPLIHNHFAQSGLLDKESYLEKPSLPYFRLPALESIDRNDPVVFNFPTGDSIYMTPGRNWDIYQLRRMTDPKMKNIMKREELITRPIDKKDHYIKRCVGIAGDSLQIIDNQLYINGEKGENPEHMQFLYVLNGDVNEAKMDELGVNMIEAYPQNRIYFLDNKQVERVRSWNVEAKIMPSQTSPGSMFPNDKNHDSWTTADYGPIYIPKAGATVKLTPQSLPFYERIIRVYEKNDMKVTDGKFIINGQETDSYTFKQDYFWMMGDNRHNSEDSRFWGYVPYDHVVGKPLFIWFSLKNGNLSDGVRWKRIFSGAK